MNDDDLIKQLDNLTMPISALIIALSERLERWVSYRDMMDLNSIKKELGAL